MTGRPGLAVIGVGGNALIRSADKTSVTDQAETVEAMVAPIVSLIAEGWRVVLTHGNGPQVGNVLRRSEIAAGEVVTIPIDYACADIQGAVGYMFARALSNAFQARGMADRAVAVVTQVRVDRDDPAMRKPVKPIGQFYDRLTAQQKAAVHGWSIKEDSGRGWRRAVPSPEPLEILELAQLRALIAAGFTVVTCGGGGIPVCRDADGRLAGVEAVIDKDLASCLLATELGADCFVLTTGVEKVALGFGTRDQRWLDHLSRTEAQALLDAEAFAAGSMAPKVGAVVRFLDQGGDIGIITSPDKLLPAMRGETGTRFADG